MGGQGGVPRADGLGVCRKGGMLYLLTLESNGRRLRRTCSYD